MPCPSDSIACSRSPTTSVGSWSSENTRKRTRAVAERDRAQRRLPGQGLAQKTFALSQSEAKKAANNGTNTHMMGWISRTRRRAIMATT